MVLDVTQWAWLGLFIFQLFVSFIFIFLYRKDKDKRKLMFGLGFLLSSYYYIFNVFNIGFVSSDSLLLNNIRNWASFPILFAVAVAIHENLMKIKKFDRLFNVYILLVVVSFLIYLALPDSINSFLTPLSNVLITVDVLIVTLFLSLRSWRLENSLFLFAIICLGVAGVSQGFKLNQVVSIFAFFMGNIFISLVFYSSYIRTSIGDSSFMDYFSLKKELIEVKSALSESEENFRILFNEMVDGIAIVDKKGKILEITNKVMEQTGYTREEIQGKNFLTLPLFDGKTKRLLIKNIALRLAGKKIPPYEVKAIGKDGHILDYELHAEKVHFLGRSAIMASFRDISERKKSEKVIIEKNEELEILNKINIAINMGKSLDDALQIIGDEIGRVFKEKNATVYLMSEDGQYLVPQRISLSSRNLRMVKKITGFNISQLKVPLHKNSIYTMILNEGKPQLINDKQSIIRLAEDYTTNVGLKKFASVILRILNINSTMLVPLISQGESIGLIDISGEHKFTQYDLNRFSRFAEQSSIAIKKIQTEEKVKKTQNELEEMNKNLEKKVEERTSRIQQLLHQKDDFINQLGHDLKNPLGPLLNLIPVIERSVTDPSTKEMLQIINRNVGYMKNLVIKTIELARLSSPNTQFTFEDSNLYEISQAAIFNNKLVLNEKNIEVFNNLPKNSSVPIDKLRIEELLNNLINNAVKYSYEKGKITIDAIENSDQITVSFKDTGIGMNKAQLNHIFDEFYKADKSRHDFDSSGLGMPICKRIVERHGGKIWAESKGLGEGSTIFFTIQKTRDSIDTQGKIPKLKPALYNRIKMIEYKGNNILHLDYSYLSEKEYLIANDHIEQYILDLGKHDLLILTDITGDHLSIESLKNTEKMSDSIKKYVKKNAVVGLSKSQSLFLKAMEYFTELEISSFDDVDQAKEWLIED